VHNLCEVTQTVHTGEFAVFPDLSSNDDRCGSAKFPGILLGASPNRRRCEFACLLSAFCLVFENCCFVLQLPAVHQSMHIIGPSLILQEWQSQSCWLNSRRCSRDRVNRLHHDLTNPPGSVALSRAKRLTRIRETPTIEGHLGTSILRDYQFDIAEELDLGNSRANTTKQGQNV